MRRKIGRNDPCPCRRFDRKYKNCCWGKVDWSQIARDGSPEAVIHLSTRGKNLLFIESICAALQLDSPGGPKSFPEFKRAFTREAVREIHEAVLAIWPSAHDLKRVLRDEQAQVSGLYVGQYERALIQRGLTRHSLYSDRILLIDPVLHAARMRPEFNPIEHPERHRTQTLQWVSLWLELSPWVEQGIVGFVRSPVDFDTRLLVDTAAAAEERFARYPEFQQLRDEQAQESMRVGEKELKDFWLLSHSDQYFEDLFRKDHPDCTESEVATAIRAIHHQRDIHPYYLEAEKDGRDELLHFSSGANYDVAKLIAQLSGSYLITDLRTRWREIELDREKAGVDRQQWSPFAKAFHGLPFTFLDSVPLSAALDLRNQGRLENMRLFLRKVWSAAAPGAAFSDQNVTLLAAELNDRVREAEAEWDKIDKTLLKLVFATAASATAGGPFLANGGAAWLAWAVANTGGVLVSTMQRRSFQNRYPAGFFLDLREGKYQ